MIIVIRGKEGQYIVLITYTVVPSLVREGVFPELNNLGFWDSGSDEIPPLLYPLKYMRGIATYRNRLIFVVSFTL